MVRMEVESTPKLHRTVPHTCRVGLTSSASPTRASSPTAICTKPRNTQARRKMGTFPDQGFLDMLSQWVCHNKFILDKQRIHTSKHKNGQQLDLALKSTYTSYTDAVLSWLTCEEYPEDMATACFRTERVDDGITPEARTCLLIVRNMTRMGPP